MYETFPNFENWVDTPIVIMEPPSRWSSSLGGKCPFDTYEELWTQRKEKIEDKFPLLTTIKKITYFEQSDEYVEHHSGICELGYGWSLEALVSVTRLATPEEIKNNETQHTE